MIGIDIVYVDRFERILLGKYGSELEARVFTERELSDAEARGAGCTLALARRFAIKEAVIKASRKGLGVSDMLRIETGESKAYVHEANGEAERFLVSGSHCQDYIIAVAIVDDVSESAGSAQNMLKMEVD